MKKKQTQRDIDLDFPTGPRTPTPEFQTNEEINADIFWLIRAGAIAIVLVALLGIGYLIYAHYH